MKMRKFLAVLAIGVSLAACGYVPPGNEGIIVNTLGDNQGVQAQTVGVGYHYLGGFSNLYNYPTFTQTYTWNEANQERITFNVQGGLPIGADIGITYHIKPGSAPALFQKYRKGIDEITNIYLHNMVRDAFNEIGPNHPVEYLTDGDGKAELVKAVQESVQAQVKDIGIDVEKVYWVSPPDLPKTIVDSIAAKNQANQLAQQKQNELVQATADAAKLVAAAKGAADARTLQATAEANANILIGKSITPELVEYMKAKQWDGKLPTVTGNSNMLFTVPNSK